LLVYTSITKSYLPKARVLAKSLKKFHPDWTFVLLYSDSIPSEFNIEKEPFDEILTIEQLGISNFKSWAFQHNIVELCTAVKGPAAQILASRPNVDKIMYLDPDIKVFNSLEQLDKLLTQYEILLTPHLLDIEQDISAIQDNEISALKHGIYNLGFFAAKTSGQGLEFIRWWAHRLSYFCRDDIPNGLFTDQRWCDLAPAFFSNLYIVRDRGYNVATWNISHRPLSKDNQNVYYVADVPLRFYHFTGYDSGAGFGMLNKYAATQNIASELWDTYGRELKIEGHGEQVYKNWHYAQYTNNEIIPSDARALYRQRDDLQKTFIDPYNSEAIPSFYKWFNTTGKHMVLLSNSQKKQHSIAKFFTSSSYAFSTIKKSIFILKTQGLKTLLGKIKNAL